MAKEITTESVKALRDATGVSVMQCKKALEEAGGDTEKALLILKEQSAAVAAKKGDRALAAGTVSAYIHAGGEAGAIVVLSSETDFVGRNEEFKKLAYDIAMHIVAAMPENVAALLEQPFVRDESLTIKGLIDKFVQKFGERIEVAEFSRYSAK